MCAVAKAETLRRDPKNVQLIEATKDDLAFQKIRFEV
jgi:hypothetical protein